MASINQQLNLAEAQPITVVKDPDLLDRLKKAFVEQIKKVKRRTAENLQHDERELSVPAVSMSQTKATENDNVDETSNKVQFKRGRKPTTKLLLEIPFSFEHPPFCFKENIDLEKVLLNRFSEEASTRSPVSKLLVKERLQNWLLEKRERCKDETKDKFIIRDCYYHHLHSKLKFRSQTEVINFLLHGDLPPKGGRKRTKLTEVAAVDNKDLGSASCESNRWAKTSSHHTETEIVNTMKSSNEGESERSMESMNNMKDILVKESNELDNEEMGDELNTIRNLEKMLMSSLDEEVFNEIDDEVIIKEYFNQPGEQILEFGKNKS